jgi:hypothetical protein
MKTTNKLLLSASAMLVLSAGAMVTGTVAWFTATRQIDVNFSNVKVMTTQADLAVELVGTAYTATPSQGVLDISGVDSTATDISGDGVNFYKPVWDVDEGVTALAIDDVTDLSTYEGYYVEFQLKISRLNPTPENGFMVYLGENTAIEPMTTGDADVAAADSARVAILNSAKTTRKIVWTPDTDDSTYQYLDSVVSEEAYGVDDFDLVSYPAESTTVDDFLVGDFVKHDTIVSTTGHSGGNSPVIADLSNPTDFEIITVRIWIEGTDEDTEENTAKEGQFTITLDLYSMGFSI